MAMRVPHWLELSPAVPARHRMAHHGRCDIVRSAVLVRYPEPLYSRPVHRETQGEKSRRGLQGSGCKILTAKRGFTEESQAGAVPRLGLKINDRSERNWIETGAAHQ